MSRRNPLRAALVPALMLAVTAGSIGVAAADDSADASARGATRDLAEALTRGDAAGLRAVLPARGKVQLRLVRLGPEEGFFSAAQVEALFADFLAAGRVRAFDVVRVEPDAEGFALVHGRAVIVDRDGRSGRIDLHLVFEPEDTRWVLRELRETL